MTQTSNLKATAVTNLDAVPAVYPTSGEGMPGFVRNVSDFVTCLSADSTSSTYKMVRIPTWAKVKKVQVWSAIASAGSGDINVAHSDSTMDGTPPALQGTIPQISSANNKLFGAAVSLVSTMATGPIDLTFKGANYTPAGALEPLWKALGFAADPGGMFDIQINITTQVTTGGLIYLSVDYVE